MSWKFLVEGLKSYRNASCITTPLQYTTYKNGNLSGNSEKPKVSKSDRTSVFEPHTTISSHSTGKSQDLSSCSIASVGHQVSEDGGPV